ncbi:auxin-responsive protein SAUR36-like [Malania oleifera]|uniref:auxin-responsive protein SAUR36-like n=1 Tax=Malania oleifera TaxID=397392 RepID=UPI0025ADFAB7|nr:auxin-responsive protein SAUR36-like [Malania oleifera]
MRKIRGFKLGHGLLKGFKRVLRQKTRASGYQRLAQPICGNKAMSVICKWGRKAKELCSTKRGSRYIRVGNDPVDAKPGGVPKGHLAVYVGEKDDDTHRFLVPVVYFNHPLFAELLKEAEKEYGFDHPGRITLPCRISDFQSVRMKIAAGENCRRRS